MDQAIEALEKANSAKELGSFSLVVSVVLVIMFVSMITFEASRLSRLEHIEGIDELGRVVRKIHPDTRIDDLKRELDRAMDRIRQLEREASSDSNWISALNTRLKKIEGSKE